MSADNGRAGGGEQDEGILANLPRTRPQRSTARRTAAREAASANGASASRAPRAPATSAATTPRPSAAKRRVKAAPGTAKATDAAGAAAREQRTRRAPARPRTARPAVEPAPIQGFESDGDRASGPVQPPGSSELVASVAELFGELAKSGLSTGERLVRDVLARLPLS